MVTSCAIIIIFYLIEIATILSILCSILVRVVDHLGRVVSAIEQTVQSGINEIRIKTGNLTRGGF
jgi:hypothetical protein